jgi:NAD(P)-dependent dehydrogenase (short-subunit alcohol dehydrogenase family)
VDQPIPDPRRPSYAARAVVTGAGSGIGRAFALELAARGGQVVCADIALDRAEETAALIGRERGRAAQCDVASLSDVSALARTADEWLDGPVDLIINNAGIGVGGLPMGDNPMEDWHRAFGVNLWGVVHGCDVFVPRLRKIGRGGVINVSSGASFAGVPLMGAYNVTKAGVLALSETLAAELAGTGVRVSVLCPAFVRTNIARDAKAIDGSLAEFAEALMRWTGRAPQSIARSTLDAYDRGKLHVLPQIEARVMWRVKRQLPGLYTNVMGLLGQLSSRFTSDPGPTRALSTGGSDANLD